MKRNILLLIAIFFLYGCPRTNSTDPDLASINSFVEPSLLFLNDSQLKHNDPSDFYYPLDAKNPNYKLLVRYYYPTYTYIQLILKNEESRKQLFKASLNILQSNAAVVNIKNIWKGSFQNYLDASYNQYDNLYERVHNNKVDLCMGAYVSLVFFNNENEKKEIADFFRKYYTAEFNNHFKKDINSLNYNKIYTITTQNQRNIINNELLPYFRKIKESEIEYCLQHSPQHKHPNQCKIDYNDWDIKEFN